MESCRSRLRTHVCVWKWVVCFASGHEYWMQLRIAPSPLPKYEPASQACRVDASGIDRCDFVVVVVVVVAQYFV